MKVTDDLGQGFFWEDGHIASCLSLKATQSSARIFISKWANVSKLDPDALSSHSPFLSSAFTVRIFHRSVCLCSLPLGIELACSIASSSFLPISPRQLNPPSPPHKLCRPVSRITHHHMWIVYLLLLSWHTLLVPLMPYQ